MINTWCLWTIFGLRIVKITSHLVIKITYIRTYLSDGLHCLGFVICTSYPCPSIDPFSSFVVWWYTPIDKNFSDRVFKLLSPQGIHVRFICAILLMAMAVFLKTRLFGMKNPHGFNVGHSHLFLFLYLLQWKRVMFIYAIWHN